MALEGFEAVSGKWSLYKDEGFDEYLQAMGVGYIKRKLAASISTTMEIMLVGDNQIRIVTKGPKNLDTTITLDTEKEEMDPFDNKLVARVTWDPVAKVMRTEANPTGDSKAKKSIVERKPFGDNELLMEVTLPNDNIVCKRHFKRCDS